MGTTVALHITDTVDDAVKFIRAASDLIVYQDLLKTVHQPEYRIYQQWCDDYYETAERFADIYEYDEYLTKMDEWMHEHASPINPQMGLSDDEQKQVGKLIRLSSYMRISEMSSEYVELEKPHWLMKYIRVANNMYAVDVSGMALLSYADVKTVVEKLKKCKDVKSAQKEFPVDGHYYDEEDGCLKYTIKEGLSAMKKLLKGMNANSFILYIES